jgi:hypothetical protein
MHTPTDSGTNLNMSFVDIDRVGKLGLLSNSLTEDDVLLKEKNLELFALKIRACRFLTADKWSMKEQVPLCSYLALMTINRSYQLNLDLKTCKQYQSATEWAKRSFQHISESVLCLPPKKPFWKSLVWKVHNQS